MLHRGLARGRSAGDSDPDVEIPDDWTEEEDGPFEAPIVSNPKCKQVSGCGKWVRPMIKNPKYKGKWVRPMMDNPDYKGRETTSYRESELFRDGEFCFESEGLKKIGAVAVEVWTMSKGLAFDNFYVGTDPLMLTPLQPPRLLSRPRLRMLPRRRNENGSYGVLRNSS